METIKLTPLPINELLYAVTYIEMKEYSLIKINVLCQQKLT